MANKQETKKRRVAAANQAARHQAAAAKAERRKRLLVGGVVGFLALALIAPLTAGLLVGDDDVDEQPITTTTFGGFPWVSGEFAGAELTGPTPCPATDGTEVRVTEFAEAPPMCIDAGAVYDLTFDTSVGSFTVPVDSNENAEVANLAAVLGWYRSYEQTPVTAVTDGLLWIGSPGDAGFTLSIAPPTDPVDELYSVGSVLAVPGGIDGGTTGALVVVLDEAGSLVPRADPRYVPVGTIDDLTELQAVYDELDPSELLLVDSVLVEPAA